MKFSCVLLLALLFGFVATGALAARRMLQDGDDDCFSDGDLTDDDCPSVSFIFCSSERAFTTLLVQPWQETLGRVQKASRVDRY